MLFITVLTILIMCSFRRKGTNIDSLLTQLLRLKFWFPVVFFVLFCFFTFFPLKDYIYLK